MIAIPEGSNRWDVPFGLKVIMLSAASIFSLMCWNVGLLLIGLILSALPLLSIGSRRSSSSALKLYALLALSFLISQALFFWGYYSGARVNVLLYIFRPGSNYLVDALTMGRGVAVTLQGIYWGLESSFKFGITYFSAIWVIYSTDPSEILKSIYDLRLPQFVKLSAISAFRVLPVMIEDMENVMSVAKARRPSSIKKRLAEPFTIVRSMIFISIKRAYHLSMALEIRGMPELEPEGKSRSGVKVALSLLFTFAFVALIALSAL